MTRSACPSPGDRAVRPPRRSFTLVELIVAIGIIIALFALLVTAAVSFSQRSEVRETENILRLLDMALQEWELEADRKITWGAVGEPSTATEQSYDMLNGTPHVYTITELLRRTRRSERVKPILAQIDPKFVHVYDLHEDASMPPWIRDDVTDDPDPNKANVTSVYSGGLNGRPLDPADPSQLNDGNGELAVLDAWGTPIRVVHPGRTSRPAVFPEDDPDDIWSPVANPSGKTNEDGTVYVNDQTDGAGNDFYESEMRDGLARNRRILFVSAGPDGRFGDVSLDPGAGGDDKRLHDQVHDNIYSYVIEDHQH